MSDAQLSLEPERKDVWIPDREQGYVAGYVVKEEGAMSVCSLATGQVVTLPTDVLSPMNPPKFEKAADIADLTYLNEASVVHNLRQRYYSSLIYTYSGLFLVAINPYHPLPIYTDSVVAAYKGQRRDVNPPHIFAVADGAMRNMIFARENQSLLITGESGAGKTENTKRVIQYLAAAATDLDNAGHGEALGLLERQILQANPILEAFGNAQTVRNNNSSRFGKFVRIEFSSNGAIAGGNIDWYLLEKSRVHTRSAKERNFHIFYQLLRSGDSTLLRSLGLAPQPEAYAYLRGGRHDIEGVDDTTEWRRLTEALRTVGFDGEECDMLFRVIAAILHLGNIELAEDRSNQARIVDTTDVEQVGALLGVDAALLNSALVRPMVRAGRETVAQSRSKKQVTDEIAALSKTLYEKTFGWIVDRINSVLDRPTSKSRFIGVLDIAGFEIFESNSFEQLCINYTNERLQQFFNHHMFMLEQEEYAREAIEWNYVNFGLDLQPTIDLIESNSPVGILACLDEECIIPKGTDDTFAEKVTAIWGSSRGVPNDAAGAAAAAERGVAHGSTKFAASRLAGRFVVHHYAGQVEYTTEQWLDKNRDPLNDNIARVLAGADEPFVASMFEASIVPEDPRKRGGRRGAFRTVGQRHKEQLASLMAQLDATQPHFVRCIVPNAEKKPGKFDMPLVLDQLRCNGVLEGIRIARLGYPNRLLFSEFRNRYELLTPDVVPPGYMDGRVVCQRIADALQLDPSVFKIGLTKIFFKAGVLADMEERRDAVLADIFTRFNASVRRFTMVRLAEKRLRRKAATETLRGAARAFSDLQQWPWWSLYMRIEPLLAATANDEARKRRELELAMAKERRLRDEREKEATAALEERFASEKQHIQELLDAEKALHADARTRAADLQARAEATDVHVAELNKQLEDAHDQHRFSEGQLCELRQVHQALVEDMSQLREQIDASAAREERLSAEAQEHSKLIDSLLREKEGLEMECAGAAKELDGLKEELRLVLTRHREQNEETEKLTRDLAARHESEASELRSQVEQANALAEQHADQLREAESAITRMEQERDHVSNQVEAAQSAAQAAEARAEELAKQLAEREAAFAELERKYSEAVEAKKQVEETVAQYATERDEAAMAAAEATNEATQQRERAEAIDAELKRVQANQSKTIVEHVHVLEEAKRYTDRQLSDVQGELSELTKYARSLEKTKLRLQQDNEQLSRLASQQREETLANVARSETIEEARAERDEARRMSEQAEQSLQKARREYDARIAQLEDELRRSRADRVSSSTDRVLQDMRGERRMSTAARKVLEELRQENERLEKDLAAKADAIRSHRGSLSPMPLQNAWLNAPQ
ncbi:class II myosin [Malassezia cuniculi]|uniref:Class II myosin n=1 Tax=Malassezia cuniculi TaxID=948313 RepID=A0AAF0EUL9_9BASI|nr:class II myosin [Malassezia cuniculi]